VAFPEGWDRCDRFTLRFADRELERAYQYADQAEGIRRARTASLLAAVVWVVVAIIGPSAVGVDPATAWAICGTMIVVLLATAGASRWATTQRRREAIGLGQQLVAGCAVLLLCVATRQVKTYAMPGIMLTAVFGFAVTRHPFVGSIAIGVAYCVLFLGVASGSGLGSQLVLQLFLVAATVVAGCVGAYLLERSQRMAYAQGRLVQALHERVDLLLHRYLSPDVARTLIEDPSRAELGGMEVDVTVLFADLRGYTAYAERRTPAEVVAMLNAAFGASVPIVLEEGGTVVQFMGDAMMAVFNAPSPQPDHARRAARAGLALQRAVLSLPEAAGRPKFRVGINSGPALVGNIGAAEIRNFLAIGDTTNLAARLQSFAPEGSVVIGAGTYELIRDIAEVRPLGAPALKGKSEAVEVYELLGLRDELGARPLEHRQEPASGGVS
jgi:class 3 adenylate cyclase